MSPATASQYPRRRPDLTLHHGADGAVLLLGTGAQVGALDAAAAALWELCDGETTIDEMVEAVCSVWDVEPAVALRDVRATLTRLEAEGFLETGAR